MTAYVFVDPIRNQRCTIHVRPRWVGVEHPGCVQPADVTIGLDCFYCQTCHYNGRISGAWVVDLIEREEADDECDEPGENIEPGDERYYRSAAGPSGTPEPTEVAEPAPEPERPTVPDLMAALEASVTAAKEARKRHRPSGALETPR